MAYPPRTYVDGAIYHVTTRGNNRQTIFLQEADFRRCLKLLQSYKRKFAFKLHAYALMPNHVHLLIEPSVKANLSRIMQSFSIAYTKYFNKKHKQVGHLFQGRFFSKLIDQEPYLLVASRYIHLNPVKAKLVKHPTEYRWSSYPAYTLQQDAWALVDTQMVLALALLNGNASDQRESYRNFVEHTDIRYQVQDSANFMLDI